MSVIKKMFAGAVLSVGLLVSGAASVYAAGIPDATATGAVSVSASSATLQASIEPNGAQTEYWMEFGIGSTFERITNRYPVSVTSGSQSVSQTVTNLSVSTTYSYRVRAQNSNGTAVSNIITFTTSAAPAQTDQPDAVATNASASQNSATLYGSVDANNLSTTYKLEYGVGNFSNSVDGLSAVTGDAATSVNKYISGLSVSTTYQFRIVAVNSKGTSYSNTKTFTTSSAPSDNTAQADATTTNASASQNSATLYGNVDPNNLSTTYRFEYGAGNFASSINGGSVSGDGSQNVNGYVSSLASNTTYQFRIVAVNSKGTSYSNVKSFSTSISGGSSVGQADATATGATSVGQYAAYLNGIIVPNGLSTEVWFEYGTGNNFQYSTENSKSSIGNGYSGVSKGITVSGLSSNTTYQYRVMARNSMGTAISLPVSFTTSNSDNGNNGGGNGGNNNNNNNNNNGSNYSSNSWAPNVSNFRIENVTQTSADVFGRVNPNGSYTEYWFEYSTDNSFNRQTSHWHLNAISGETNVSLMIGNLNPGTSYNVRLVASNGHGTVNGSVLSLTTLGSGSISGLGILPIVATFSASDISRNTAILHAKVSPAGLPTSIWFEYGTSAANFGKMTSVQNIGGDYSYRSFTAVATGLSANTTYYYRVAAANNRGTSYGAVLSFRTPSYVSVNPGTPVITTDKSGEETPVATVDVMLDPSVSRLEPSAGDEFDYTLTYRNASKNVLSKTVIKVSLPLEVDLIDANVKPANVSGNILSFEIGEVAKNSQGIITIRVKIKPEVSGGSTIMFNSFMEYTDAAKKFQSINSYISVTVKGDPEATADNGGFLGSLAGFAQVISGSWLLILLLILVLIALIYLVVTRRRDRLNS